MRGPNFRKVGLFTAITFSLSWTIVGVYLALGGTLNSVWALPILLLYMFMPACAAVTVQKIIYKEPAKEALGISFQINRWYVVAWLLPPILSLAAFLAALLLPGVEYTGDVTAILERSGDSLSPEQLEEVRNQLSALPIHLFWLALAAALLAGPTINAIAGLGEELGWRGLLQTELHALGFWKSSAVIGLIWGAWHAPLVLHGHNYPEHPGWGVLAMIVLTILLSPLIGYVRLKARSVMAAAVMHGSLNASGGLAILLLRGGNDLTVGITGLTGLAVLAVANLVLFVCWRRFGTPLP